MRRLEEAAVAVSTDAIRERADEVLELWFGPLDALGLASDTHRRRWWGKDPAFDAMLRDRFAGLHDHLRSRPLAHDTAVGERGVSLAETVAGAWGAAPRSALAAVLVLDQFSRNMHRGTAKMFEADALALALAEHAIAQRFDEALAVDEAVFLYMPRMHAEDLEAQERCIAAVQRLLARNEAPEGGESHPVKRLLEGTLRFAEEHAEIIRRFGRFPHRNATLGRQSTVEELAFLETHQGF